ncbi:MAG: hypothetical protein K2H49_05440 [Muribaculaceae bacterium]|nr:hypothetical protein [Muribaculaceae bacterium]
MERKLVKVSLPPENPEELPRECRMSVELFQNARMTMGELRDLMRQIGISWDFIQFQIDFANRPSSPLDKALRTMDPYATGPGRSLRDLPPNVW